MNCRCALEKRTINKKICFKGISVFDLEGLVVYTCPECGKVSETPVSLKKVEKLKKDLGYAKGSKKPKS